MTVPGLQLSFYPNPRWQPGLHLGDNGSLGRLVRNEAILVNDLFHVDHSEIPGILRGHYALVKATLSQVVINRVRDGVPLGKEISLPMRDADLVIVEIAERR